ncbi:Retrovirus-related Pol polyprotein from transposon RE2 [Vitis vinifera]|uniref:Retrovirus-related Pol polyprotein from transposon RE2 n=1 Tax=Vitis vinifera TaxID=29760 RepID=A0A438FRB6_VITVI|nr:Retrovirus-related Pol polyprotein from transposon RE2 [Vitis vinifera]
MVTKNPIFTSVISGSPTITSEKLIGSENYTSQSITLTSSDYDVYLRYQVVTSASIASVTQTGNVSICFTQSPSLGPWILDSGASDHISGNKHIFSSITTTSALPTVTLANGSQTMAKGNGLAHPLPSLPLHSVFYAPEYPFNLISISKITRTLNCSITFFDKSVILQDQSTGQTIDIGRESQGLYHLTSPSSPAACISTDAPLLIHNRLGHPILSKFQKMVPRFSTLSSFTCESCQLGKHTHVSFPKRLNNRAKSPFELVHTDVWGPCRTASTLGFQYFVTFIDDYSRYTRRAIIVIPLTLIVIFSPLMSPSLEDSPFFPSSESLPISEVLSLPYISPPSDALSCPLQVYHRRHRVVALLSSAEVLDDSPLIPPISPTPTLSSTEHLPIAL